MITADQLTNLKDLLSQSQSILVIFGAQANFDQVSAAVTLGLSLQQAGKEVLLAAPDQMRVEMSQVVGVDLVKNSLGHQNLNISFAYEESMVDKVSYHIDEEGKRFHLLIKPQKGAQPLDSKTVEFAYTGADADLIFLVGVHELESLDQLYSGYEDLYQTKTIVTFHTFEPTVGQIKLNVGDASCLSEAMAILLEGLGLPFDSDIATNLLSGIEDATQGFKALSVSADTFEMVSRLMRLGGRRVKRLSGESSERVMLKEVHNQPSWVSVGDQLKTQKKPVQPGEKQPRPTHNLAQALSQTKRSVSPAGGLKYQPQSSENRG